MRPADLARDDSSEWLVWRHALHFLRESGGAYPETLIVVPATAPLRAPADLEACLDEFEKGDADAIITVTHSHRSPYFNMVKRRSDGTVGLVMPLDGSFIRRQDAPVVYDMTTVAYVVRPEFVMTRNGILDGRVRQVLIRRSGQWILIRRSISRLQSVSCRMISFAAQRCRHKIP